MTQQDPNDFLMGGGSANPAWKFDEPGTTRTGTVMGITSRQEREYDPKSPGAGALKSFPSGDPIMGVLADMKTNEHDPSIEADDGRRTFYIEGRYLKEAVREGVLAVGAKGLEPGGRLTVTFTHRDDPYDKRSRKHWQVQYIPAAQAQLMQPPAAPVAAPPATPFNPGQATQPAVPAAAAAALGNLTPELIQQILAAQAAAQPHQSPQPSQPPF